MSVMNDIACQMEYRETSRRRMCQQPDVSFDGFYYLSYKTGCTVFVVTSEPMRGQMFDVDDIEPA